MRPEQDSLNPTEGREVFNVITEFSDSVVSPPKRKSDLPDHEIDSHVDKGRTVGEDFGWLGRCEGAEFSEQAKWSRPSVGKGCTGSVGVVGSGVPMVEMAPRSGILLQISNMSTICHVMILDQFHRTSFGFASKE